jgi:hypothetical protein
MTPLYTDLINPAALPQWEAQAAAEGRILDHWQFYPGRDDLIAVRLVRSIEERDEARSFRYLGLDVPRR